ncbi:MAG: Rieske (2Fe-2S) protein [Chloroflexi bacterium]|nr:Rieske (2Fe-2S) protein [Chloroflexota bacterium]
MTAKSGSRLSRREFVKFVTLLLGSIMGAVVGLPIIGYLIGPAVKTQKLDDWIPLGKLTDYPVGAPALFTFTRARVNGWEKTSNSYGVYVWRKSETDLVVFSNVCTHLSCRVAWHTDAQEYICPCHDGRYDIEGNVTKGPPPRPLDRYEYKVEDGIIIMRLLA